MKITKNNNHLLQPQSDFPDYTNSLTTRIPRPFTDFASFFLTLTQFPDISQI